MLGLKRGAVALYPHEKAWETEAQATMARLRQILGPVAVEMAHVGSTAIPTIQAKPIVDIAVAVDDFDTLLAYEKQPAKLPTDSGREDYVQGKQSFIRSVLRRALSDMLLGKTVDIRIDRPLGSHHPKHTDMIYPVNYGYVPHIFSADGEEADVYLLGVSQPVEKYKGRVIAVIHRLDDVEDKWIAAPAGVTFTPDEIEKAVNFQEQYFQHEIEMLDPNGDK